MKNTNKSIKILMIGPFPDPITGMSLSNKMIFEGLKNNGYLVEYIDTDTEKKIESLQEQGKFNIIKIKNSIKPILKGIKKILFKKYDAIYITPGQSFMGFIKYSPFMFISKIRKISLYIHIHGGYIREMYNNSSIIKKIILKRLFNFSTKIIILGDSLKGMFKDLVEDNKIYICKNGIDDKYVIDKTSLKNKFDKIKKEKKLRMLYLSNLMESKGILETLEICKKLKEKNIDFTLDIAGSIEENIQSKIKENFEILKNNIVYHGVVDGEDKKNLLMNSEIFCLPISYKFEGQPIAILEAMGMGCVIVTTYNGGIKDIFIDSKNGYLYDSNIENLINRIISDSKNRYQIALNNIKYINGNHKIETVINNIELLLHNK